MPFEPHSEVWFKEFVPEFPNAVFVEILVHAFGVGLGSDHLEKAHEYIQGVSNCQKDDLSIVLTIHGGSVGEMSLVDPAFVFDKTLTLESWILQGDVEGEFHQLVTTGGDSGYVLEVLSEKGISWAGVAGVRNCLERSTGQELSLPAEEPIGIC